jgi:preprotein translocase SecE subunit
MARDRQRGKQRKARRAGQNPGPSASEPHRSNVPGELEHASGEADEFDAALVSGAGGEAIDETAGDDALTSDGDEHLTAGELAAEEAYEEEHEGLVDGDESLAREDVDDEHFGDEDEALAEEAVAAAPATRGRRREAAGARRDAAPGRSLPARFIAFLRASWAELQRVQWPDRRQVAQATAVVLGFVVVAGLYLGVADRVAQEVVDFII